MRVGDDCLKLRMRQDGPLLQDCLFLDVPSICISIDHHPGLVHHLHRAPSHLYTMLQLHITSYTLHLLCPDFSNLFRIFDLAVSSLPSHLAPISPYLSALCNQDVFVQNCMQRAITAIVTLPMRVYIS